MLLHLRPVHCGKMMTLKFQVWCILCWEHSSTRYIYYLCFCAWCEDWEKTRFTSIGRKLFQVNYSEKYHSLMLADVDKEGQIGRNTESNCALHWRCYKSKQKKTILEPVQGYNHYYALLVCFDGFNTEKPFNQQDEYLWVLWELLG